jgi:hypothetical protein
MKIYISIALAICCITIVACSKTYYDKKMVLNKTFHQLRLLKYNKISHEIDGSYFIQPQQQFFVENITRTRTGSFYDNGKACGSGFNDSIIVEVVNNATLLVAKDLNDANNWVFSTHSDFKSVTSECRATITDADIVPK